MDRVRRAVAACDSCPSAPVVIFVSKMIPVKKRDITDTDGKLWRPPAGLSEEEAGDGEDDRDSLAFVAFARVLSGTVTPDTPLLVSGRVGEWARLAIFVSVHLSRNLRNIRNIRTDLTTFVFSSLVSVNHVVYSGFAATLCEGFASLARNKVAGVVCFGSCLC